MSIQVGLFRVRVYYASTSEADKTECLQSPLSRISPTIVYSSTALSCVELVSMGRVHVKVLDDNLSQTTIETFK